MFSKQVSIGRYYKQLSISLDKVTYVFYSLSLFNIFYGISLAKVGATKNERCQFWNIKLFLMLFLLFNFYFNILSMILACMQDIWFWPIFREVFVVKERYRVVCSGFFLYCEANFIFMFNLFYDTMSWWYYQLTQK